MTAEIMRLDWPHHDLKMLVSSEIERAYRVNACAKEPFTADWLRRLGPGDVLVNVGACVGSYVLPAAAQGAHVMAVEPNILNLARLCENVLLNGLGERVMPVWAVVGDMPQAVVSYRDTSRGVASNPIQTTPGRRSIAVAGRPLAVLLQGPAHLLIDVDGAEVAVLESVSSAWGLVRSVMLEMQPEHEPSCSDILAGAGLARVARHTHRNGQPMGVVYAEWGRPA